MLCPALRAITRIQPIEVEVGRNHNHSSLDERGRCPHTRLTRQLVAPLPLTGMCIPGTEPRDSIRDAMLIKHAVGHRQTGPATQGRSRRERAHLVPYGAAVADAHCLYQTVRTISTGIQDAVRY